MRIGSTFIQDKERALFCIEKREEGTMNLKLKMENYFLDIWKDESKYYLLLSLWCVLFHEGLVIDLVKRIWQKNKLLDAYD